MVNIIYNKFTNHLHNESSKRKKTNPKHLINMNVEFYPFQEIPNAAQIRFDTPLSPIPTLNERS